MRPLTDLGHTAQRRLGAALRSRVAGDDATERAKVIWGRPGKRWFAPEDPVWRVHADAAMFPGGMAALLLQSLHPLAMAGVAGHSGYRGDPWGRLQRTSHFLATTTFGTVEDAEAAIARVRAIHERVRGRDHRGRPYRAADPHLLGWVHVAEAHSFLAAYQRYAVAIPARLRPAAQERPSPSRSAATGRSRRSRARSRFASRRRRSARRASARPPRRTPGLPTSPTTSPCPSCCTCWRPSPASSARW